MFVELISIDIDYLVLVIYFKYFTKNHSLTSTIVLQ